MSFEFEALVKKNRKKEVVKICPISINGFSTGHLPVHDKIIHEVISVWNTCAVVFYCVGCRIMITLWSSIMSDHVCVYIRKQPVIAPVLLSVVRSRHLSC